MRYSSPPVDATQSQGIASGVNPNPNVYAQGHVQQGGAGAGPSHRGPGQYAPAPQGYGAGPGVGADAYGFGAWGGMNDATAQMGVQFGKSAVAAGQDYMEKNVSGAWRGVEWAS